ncbi:MAG: hypothetical protein M1162_04850 [Candidatus Thermoplasmatota archaeon]|nr:hypothetical protein [Candidatus Thermoplasmatota archaeon]
MLKRLKGDALDIKVTISTKWKSDLFRLTGMLGLRIPCIYANTSPPEIFFVVPSSYAGNLETRKLLMIMGGREAENHWTGRISIDNKEISDAISNVLSIPSLVLDAAFLDTRSFKLLFRLNSMYTGKLTELIESAISDGVPLDIEYLGPIESPYDNLDAMNRIIPLSVIYFRIDSYMFKKTSDPNPLGIPYERDRKFTSLSDRLQFVYHCPNAPEQIDDKAIVETVPHLLYETWIENPFLTFIESKLIEMKILVSNYHMAYDGERIYVEVVLPTTFVGNYLEFLSLSADRYQEWGALLFGVYTYNQQRDLVKEWAVS